MRQYYPNNTTPWEHLRIGRTGSQVHIIPDISNVISAVDPITGDPAHIIDIEALDRELQQEKQQRRGTLPAPKTIEEELAELPEEERKQVERELSIWDDE